MIEECERATAEAANSEARALFESAQAETIRTSGSGSVAPAVAAALATAAALAACGGGNGSGGFGGVGGGAGEGGAAGSGGSGSDIVNGTNPPVSTGSNAPTNPAAPGTPGAPAGGSPPAPGGSLGPVATTPTATGYLFTQAKNDAEAARFLLQAQFSASNAEIAAVRAKGYLPWLGEQMDAPKAQTGWAWLNAKPYRTVYTDNMVWKQLMASPDAVRKRVALALSEIFVVSQEGIGSNWADHMMASYWDTLVAGASANFRQLLEDVSLHPAMGYYLNVKGNLKEDGKGRQPDENYAREVMQLMTIGLYQLNPDGTAKGTGDQPAYSYTQDDVSNLARVFTGWDLDIRTAEKNAFTPPGENYTIESNQWTLRPMALDASRHSTLAATFLGTTVPAGTDGKAALKIALDALFNHPNVGPFIGQQLIQRLVTSNPSPAYVARVSAVFANNGAGVRGDMKSVVAAVLLDNEARDPAGLADSGFGHLREPMLRFIQWGRTFGLKSATDDWKIGNLSSSAYQLGQSPLRSPSVFNFFRPGYVPPSTALAASGKVAPEFQLVNETTVGGYLNFMQNNLANGFASKDVIAPYTAEKALVLDPVALVARLNLLMAAGQIAPSTQKIMSDALATPAVTASSSDTVKANRVYAAVLMTMAAPEYLIQK